MRKKRKIVAFSFCLLLLCGFLFENIWNLPFTVEAATITEDRAKISQLQEELRVLRNSSSEAADNYATALSAYEDAQTDYEKAKAAKIALDEEICALESEVDATQSLLEVYNDQKTAYESAVAEKQTEIDDLYEVFIGRLRLNYEDSFTSYLEVLMSADSFSDLLYRVDVVASLLEYDKRILSQLDKAKSEQDTLLAEYEELLIETQTVYDSLTDQIPILEERREKSVLLLQQMETALEAAREAKEESAEAKATYEAAVAAKQKEMNTVQSDLNSKIKEAEEAEAARKAAEKKANYVGGTFGWPVDVSYSNITSYFTYRSNPLYGYTELHNGIDIPAPYGADIYAANSGTVIVAEYHYSYGYYIVIDHGGGISTLYAHNSRLLVSVGDTVSKGDVIAKCGSTGYATGNHCHFSVRVNGVFVNPLNGYVVQP